MQENESIIVVWCWSKKSVPRDHCLPNSDPQTDFSIYTSHPWSNTTWKTPSFDVSATLTSDVNLTSCLTLALLSVTDLRGSVAYALNSSSRSLIQTCDGLSFTDVTSLVPVVYPASLSRRLVSLVPVVYPASLSRRLVASRNGGFHGVKKNGGVSV